MTSTSSWGGWPLGEPPGTANTPLPPPPPQSVSVSLPTRHLADILKYLEYFATDHRNFPVVECREGSFIALRGPCIAQVTYPGFDDLPLRIRETDIRGALQFLKTYPGIVEVREYPGEVVLQVEGASLRFPQLRKGVPSLGAPPPNQHTWNLLSHEVRAAVDFLNSTAANRALIGRISASFGIKIEGYDSRMKRVVGDVTVQAHNRPLPGGGISAAYQGSSQTLPEKCTVCLDDLAFVIESMPKNTNFTLGASVVGKGGFFRFVWKKEQIEYDTILAWIRPPG